MVCLVILFCLWPEGTIDLLGFAAPELISCLLLDTCGILLVMIIVLAAFLSFFIKMQTEKGDEVVHISFNCISREDFFFFFFEGGKEECYRDVKKNYASC